ncbi:MAG: hypothetical protein KY467_16945 [Gemmatimonadetes bacterium]|nr:hypothetical protein [Gemmatimonadota bacterium]
MPPPRTLPDPDPDPADVIGGALTAAEAAAERFATAKTEVLHALASVDEALVELVQRVFDATPPEFKRSYTVSFDDADPEQMDLPEFVRALLERPGGTRAEVTISVAEDLYDDGAGEGDDREP